MFSKYLNSLAGQSIIRHHGRYMVYLLWLFCAQNDRHVWRFRCIGPKCLMILYSLQWRHNERDGVSNHQPHNYLLNRLFTRRSKQTSRLCVTGRCVGNSPVTGDFPTQMASNAKNVSIWWHHHEFCALLHFIHLKHLLFCQSNRGSQYI